MHVVGVQRAAMTLGALERLLMVMFINLGTKVVQRMLACTCHIVGPKLSSVQIMHVPSHIIENQQLSTQRDP